jgi:hypothetical protein
MSAKSDLLAEAAREFTVLHDAIEGLSEDQMNEVWLGHWSVKDIAAHIAGWHREMEPALARLARGEKPTPAGTSYEDADAWNARFVEARRGVEASEVLLELDRSHEAFLRAADQVPDDRFQPGRTAWNLVNGASAHHYREHAEQIRAWRASRGL